MEEEELYLDIESANAEDNKKLTLALMKCQKVCDEVEKMQNLAKLCAEYDSDSCDSTMEDILEYCSIREDLIELETVKCLEETKKRIANRNSYLKRWKEIARDKRGKKGTIRRFKSRDRRRDIRLKSLRSCYLNSNPTLPEQSFIHKFRIPRETYRQIRLDILEYEKTLIPKKQFFLQRSDVSGKKGINSHLKLLAALEILGHNTTYEELEGLYGISTETIRLSCIVFCKRLIELYANDFIRMPTVPEAKRILKLNYAKRGLPFYLGSVDCSHIVRTKCQYELRGEYTGKDGKPTVKIEAMADENRYFWHFSVGEVGSRNDLNTWYESALASEMLKHRYDTLVYNVGDMSLHGFPFILGDQIYPNQRHVLKLYQHPTRAHEITFNTLHSGARKAIEIAFGNLQNCFNVTKESRQHYRKGIVLYTKAAAILYNMNIITRVAQRARNDKTLFVWDLPEKYNWLTAQYATATDQADLNELVGHSDDEDVENTSLSIAPAMRWSDELGQEAVENMYDLRTKIAYFVHTETRKNRL